MLQFLWISAGCPLMSLGFQEPIQTLNSLHSMSCVPNVLCFLELLSFSPGLSWPWQSWELSAMVVNCCCSLLWSGVQTLSFEEDTTQVRCPTCPISSGYMWQQCVLALGISALISWLHCVYQVSAVFSPSPPLSFGDEFLSLAMLREGRTVRSPSWRGSLYLLFRMLL